MRVPDRSTLPTVPWPPADTDRNRLLLRAGLVVGAIAVVYFVLWALQSGALLIWTFLVVALFATLVVGGALLAMRRPASGPGPAADAGGPPAGGRASGTPDAASGA